MQANSFLANLSDYTPGKSMDEVRELYGLKDIIKLASNENPLGPSPLGIQAAQETLPKVHLYPRGDSPDLRKSLAQKFNLSADHFIVANGSDEVIQYLSMVLLSPNDSMLTSSPTFSEYKFNALIAGASVKLVPLNSSWNHNLDEIFQAIEPSTKIIYLCSPNNPTGTWIPKSDLLAFIHKVPSHILIAVDQAYAEYCTDPDYPSLIPELGTYPNLILLRTFSKLYGLAGLRCGYAIANPQLIRWMMKVKQPFNVNLVAQVAAQAALFDESHIQKSIEVNELGMKLISDYFKQKNIPYLGSGANFIAVQLGTQAAAVVQKLESKGMIIRHLKSFGMEDWVRITIGVEHENNTLIQLLNEIL